MEPCSLCNGEMKESIVEVIKKTDHRLVLIRDVPAYSCQQCGERYYSIETIEHVERLLVGVEQEAIEFNSISAAEVAYRSEIVST